MEEAEATLVQAVERCPRHPEILAELAALQFQQGRYEEAAVLADRYVELAPESGWGWNLLGASRYLAGQSVGALEAWNRLDRPRVDAVDWGRTEPEAVRRLRPFIGLPEGGVLTPEELVRSRRLLEDLPALARSGIAYGPTGEGRVRIRVSADPGPRAPLSLHTVPAHLARALRGGVRLASSGALGRLDHWELAGETEGSLDLLRVAVALPLGSGGGIHRWKISGTRGEFQVSREGGPEYVGRRGVRWEYQRRDLSWIRIGTLLGMDDRVATGMSLVAGGVVAMDILEPREGVSRGSVRWQMETHHPVGSGGTSLDPRRFARVAVHAQVRWPFGSTGGSSGGPSGGPPGLPTWEVDARGGVDAISEHAPPDLRPRFGADRSANRLLRAHSAVDSEGVVRNLLPGTGWLSGGVEVRRWGSGPIGGLVGAAVFADGATRLAHGRHSTPRARQGRIDAGAGLRLRLPGTGGHLRLDWATSLHGGGSRFSAAWVGFHQQTRSAWTGSGP